MILSPVLAGLRRDPAPQLLAQEAMEAAGSAWRALPEVATILSDLAAYGGGADLARCETLSRLMASHDRALRFAEAFIVAQTRALSAHLLGHVAFRSQLKPGLATVQLAQAGRANICLLTLHSRDIGPAGSVAFTSGERHELCLAGTAAVRMFTLKDGDGARATIACSERSLTPGDRITIADTRRARTIDRADNGLVMLRLGREDSDPIPSREYRIADGALLHVASGDRAESRAEMAAAVLGAMGRRDAAPVLAALARSGSDHLRWQALRQLLALDSGAGFDVLSEIAANPGDSLAAPAGALRAALVERHPQLLESPAPCLA